MIIDFGVSNHKAFGEKVELSFVADKRIRTLRCNTVETHNIALLKAIGLYGSNNTGKTCFLQAINNLKMALLGVQNIPFTPNFFTNDSVTKYSVTFLNLTSASGIFHYEFAYDVTSHEYIYEKLERLVCASSRNCARTTLFERDKEKKVYSCDDKNAEPAIAYATFLAPLLYGMNIESSEKLSAWRKECQDFANSLDIIAGYNIPIDKTISILKGSDEKKKKLIVEFVKNADLSLDSISYDEGYVPKDSSGTPINENILRNIGLNEQMRLFSTYRGVKVPSLAFDSTGTKKIEAYASYIVDAIQQGKTLIIDELEGSLHFTLTRSIVALFNNMGNTKAQLLFSTQDVALLDCPSLMRKEQIWFANRTKEKVEFYSLASFTAKNANVRKTSNFYSKYSKGSFKAIPNPDLIRSLMEMLKNE